MKRGLLGLAVSLAMISPAHAVAGESKDIATLFGARPSVESASLSPDGQMLLFVQPMAGQGSGAFVADLRGQGKLAFKRILVATGDPERMDRCEWSSNSRLLCHVYQVTRLDMGDLAYVDRFIAINADGSNMQMIQAPRGSGASLGYALYGGRIIDWTGAGDGHVLISRGYVPEQILGTRGAQTRDGYGVDDLDTVTLKSRSVEKPRKDAVEYITDGVGTVRVMGERSERDGYSSDVVHYSYRMKDGGDWQSLSDVAMDRLGFDPVAVDPVLNVAYGRKRTNGRLAAWSKALDGSGAETLVYAHPGVDVDGFVRMGRNGRVIGVTYATDKREVAYFDPVFAKLATALGKAIPDLPLIGFVASSQDEKRLLIHARSDVDPGRYFLFDRNTGHLDLLTLDRPDLEHVPLASVKPVSYPAADGTMVPGYLTLPPGKADAKGLPAIVLPHGGPGARDEWGFDWLSQYFANQGFAVLQPNFRGSAGYGEKWFQDNGFKSWRTAIGDVDDAGRWLVSQGIADPSKLAIFGWSYGGYAALQSAVTEPGLFKAVVAVAPVTDLNRLKEESRYWSNFLNVRDFIGSGPHIEEGSPARHADNVKAPVLMFHGTLDRNVGVDESRLMQSRLESAGTKSQLVIYDGLDHYLDDSQARADMLSKSSAFIKQALGL